MHARGMLCAAVMLCLAAIAARAQDPLFTMHALQPLTLNPALTGGEGKYRASFGHRSQWQSLGVPFLTNTAAFDMRIVDSDAGALSVGLMFMGDRAGDPAFTTSQFNLSLAYTLRISDDARLSAGLNIAYDQRGVQAGAGQWASQYNGVSYDPGTPSGEAFGDERLSSLHAGLGMVYSYDNTGKNRRGSKNVKVTAGASVAQIGDLEVTRANAVRHDFNARITIFADAAFDLGDGGLGLEPLITYVNQGNFDIFMTGALLRYAILDSGGFASNAKPLYVAAGPYWRVNEAVAAAARLHWGDYILGLSYDFIVSDITRAVSQIGAWEVSVVYAVN